MLLSFFKHLRESVVVSCGLNMHFLNGMWIWQFFHVFLAICILSLEKWLFRPFAYFVNDNIFIFIIELWVSSIYSGHTSCYCLNILCIPNIHTLKFRHFKTCLGEVMIYLLYVLILVHMVLIWLIQIKLLNHRVCVFFNLVGSAKHHH